MKIKHYLYNAFLIEDGKSKIAIDPGQNFWMFKFQSLIPRTEWKDITHILVTHGDPDHHWQTDRVADASNGYVICGKEMTKVANGKTLVVDPRGKDLISWIYFKNLHTIQVGDTKKLGDVTIEAIKSVHGTITVPILWFKKKKYPGPTERTGLGSIGYKITLNNKTIVNLGDSVLQKEWKDLKPDVLMLPIGGAAPEKWTMDIDDALQAVKEISPKKVIPCHYNVSFLWIKNINPADGFMFKKEVEKMGIECELMNYGDEIRI